jgi:AcrR family transcriptional regulator
VSSLALGRGPGIKNQIIFKTIFPTWNFYGREETQRSKHYQDSIAGCDRGSFIKYGYDAVLLRQITERAQVNLAAVNYHFGDKDSLMKTLLMQRLEPLNEQRLELLARCEAESDGPLDCDTLLGVLFAPAMGLERSDPASGEGRSFIRFLGRVYSDTSPFIQEYLKVHYQPVFQRFFEAFALALPDLPRNELGVRLQFALKAISGVMAGTELRLLMNSMSLGRPATDAEVMAVDHPGVGGDSRASKARKRKTRWPRCWIPSGPFANKRQPPPPRPHADLPVGASLLRRTHDHRG